MDLNLRNKSALVSGSTKGIGFAIVSGLAREGASVILNGRSQASVDEALGRLRERDPNADAQGFAGDLSDPQQIKRLLEQFPEVDILVNNLGIFDPKPFEDICDEEWERFFNTNVMSGVRLSRAYLPKMKAKNWGRVVFISSESGVQIPVEMIHYGVTKTAQLGLSRGLAESCAGTGVTVNAVLPGPTSSEGVSEFVNKLSGGQPFAEFEKEFFEKARPTSLLKRFTTPEEVANMVIYVCSQASSATNGAALRVDGGVVKSAF
ncbi:SDR family oxidoreductase [Pseudomonas sp. CCI3.2]|uniref:SDR family NAD(P)-dependent oxidoreductase n=1 Tax=unclassified Pseudomonas TaxID=196821 RepID=UPI002AC8D3D0|nr:MULTISPECIES: SDR family oxidoreductase [unclassified Pseudomonas]MEB0078483.1 SDR family oxidoreductase [Pseudomonas sp. MH10out]MEB0090111.1 SDR family oxidoreductase [Pseudomonas sp. CCI4.2]MEB0104517.1 SDR family oxidoreductase [Pseudomonas sp. CCI3.2]MEB0131734.1 SDR family oxidoreductase [Pseudomonas sp. CCI2.4]MEB0158106.1 SDR family oxidoreductase [Pseudomonas sp. AH2 (2023)]